MKILTTIQKREADQYTIQNEPISSVDLMERAAGLCTDWILKHWTDKKQQFKIFVGPGNNGGDGLVIARLLANAGFNPKIFLVSEKLSSDAQINLERLLQYNNVKIFYLTAENSFPDFEQSDIIIDALFGSGLSKPLHGFVAQLVDKINQSGCQIISIDIPSGLLGEDNFSNQQKTQTAIIIKATCTLTFQTPWLSFFFAENENYIGQWFVFDIGLQKDFIQQTNSFYYLLEKIDVDKKIVPRKKFAHKGHFGHALLIAGSKGKIGAAVLAAKACLKSGVGLLTVNCPSIGNAILQTAVPEAMLQLDESENYVSKIPTLENYTAIGIGPGVGTNPETQKVLFDILKSTSKPLLIDADAINILGMNQDWFSLLPANSVLTPHPKEFERIAGKISGSYNRHLFQIEMSIKYQVIIVLKGGFTSITTPDGFCYFNPTGNPGMATAGSGDVLTGIILSLLAQGYNAVDAAIIGVYYHGLAGDFATSELGEISMLSSDIIENLHKVFPNKKSVYINV